MPNTQYKRNMNATDIKTQRTKPTDEYKRCTEKNSFFCVFRKEFIVNDIESDKKCERKWNAMCVIDVRVALVVVHVYLRIFCVCVIWIFCRSKTCARSHNRKKRDHKINSLTFTHIFVTVVLFHSWCNIGGWHNSNAPLLICIILHEL